MVLAAGAGLGVGAAGLAAGVVGLGAGAAALAAGAPEIGFNTHGGIGFWAERFGLIAAICASVGQSHCMPAGAGGVFIDMHPDHFDVPVFGTEKSLSMTKFRGHI